MKSILIAFFISVALFLDNSLFYNPNFQTKKSNDKFFEIKYAELLNQKNIIKLSQLASKVEYIQLETNENCLINNNAKYYFTDKFIFVSNNNHVLKFSSDGKFLKKIGNPGRGPGEISSIWSLSVISEKKSIVIYDAVAGKLKYFSFDGDLIRSVNIPRDIAYINFLNNGSYIAMNQASSASEKYTFVLISEAGDTLSTIKNYIYWKNPSPIGTQTRIPSFIPFYAYQNNYFLKSVYNDTVYVIKANKIIPSYYINLGKYKLPQEKRFERLNPEEARLFQKEASKYRFVYVLEVGGRFFLTSNNYGNQTIEHFIISKKVFIENSNDKYLGVFNGYIINDWDGGLFLWPQGSISDNKLFMPIYIEDLKKIMKVTTSSNYIPIKFPALQKQLEKLASESDITENPLLMVVTLKSEND